LKPIIKIFILILLLVPITYEIQAQDDSFSTIIDELTPLMVKVESSKFSYSPEIEIKNNSVLRYSYLKSNIKGTSDDNLGFELNFADIDAYTVRENTKGDVITVDMKIKNNQKLIKTFVNDDIKPYTSTLSIVALNIDNAREIRRLIEKSIPLAENMLNTRLSLETYQEMISWLEGNIGKVEEQSADVEQLLRHDSDFPGKIMLRVLTTGKNSKEEEFTLNLADINENSFSFQISGSQFGLKFETVRKQDLIGVISNGETKPFTNRIIVETSNVEDARDLRSVLIMAVPEARKLLDASLTNYSSAEESLLAFKQELKDVSAGQQSFEQSIEPDCQCSFTITSASGSKSSTTIYSLNLMDINDKFIDFKTSGSKMMIDVDVVQKQKLVAQKKDGEQAAYISTFSIYGKDTENARRLKHILKQVVEQCHDRYQYNSPEGNMDDRMTWLKEEMGSVRIKEKEYSQEISQVDASEPEKFSFTQRVIDSKGSTEHIYELSLSDLDENNINYEITGLDLSVKVQTKFKDKIIKYYKDGDIQNYQYSFEIKAKNVEQARNLINGLKEMVALAKKG